MNIYFLLVVLIALAIYALSIKTIKGRSRSKNTRLDILSWMEMTPDQRHALDEGEKKSTFKRKRRLLDQIRKEYAALDSKKRKVDK